MATPTTPRERMRSETAGSKNGDKATSNGSTTKKIHLRKRTFFTAWKYISISMDSGQLIEYKNSSLEKVNLASLCESRVI